MRLHGLLSGWSTDGHYGFGWDYKRADICTHHIKAEMKQKLLLVDMLVKKTLHTMTTQLKDKWKSKVDRFKHRVARKRVTYLLLSTFFHLIWIVGVLPVRSFDLFFCFFGGAGVNKSTPIFVFCIFFVFCVFIPRVDTGSTPDPEEGF